MCSRGITSTWPLKTGRRSRKATVCGVSATRLAASSPETMRQKTQSLRMDPPPWLVHRGPGYPARGRSLARLVRTLPRRRGVALPDHELAAEVADLLAALVEAARLDRDDPAVGLARRRRGLEHLRLGVDGVAVEGRLAVLELLDLEVRDARAAHVGDAHPEHHRVHEVAHHHVLLELRLGVGVPLVKVERMVVHGDETEEVVVVLGDGLARPV